MLKADPSNTPPRANVEIEQAAETLGSKGKRKEGQRLGKEGPLTAACRNASMITSGDCGIYQKAPKVVNQARTDL